MGIRDRLKRASEGAEEGAQVGHDSSQRWLTDIVWPAAKVGFALVLAIGIGAIVVAALTG